MALRHDLAPPVRPKATLVYSPHPLLVDAGRIVQQTVAIRGESVGDYLRRHGIDTTKPLVVSVDGRALERDEWELLDAEEGMLVAARGALADGDGGSQVVALVAMIALAVFAPYLAGAAYGMATGGTAMTMAQAGVWAANTAIGAVMTGAVTMAGSMLINKLMPPPKMDLGRGLGAAQASATYSITGGQNRARPFEPLALVLGTHRVFFDLAGRPYSTYEGEDQYLYQVFHVGLVGPHGALDISDLRIGTTLLSTYESVATEISIGAMPAMMPANVDTIAGAAITASAPVVVRTTSPNTTKIELDFTALSFRARSDGDIDPALLDWTIEYCPAGSGAWQTLETVSTNGNGQKPLRLTRSVEVAAGTYDVRVTGITLSTSEKFIRQLTWDGLKSYQPDDGYYEGQQFLAVKIKATGQLHGVIDRLNGIVRMPTAPGVYSSNPADLLTLFAIGHKAADGRPLWGGQLSSSALDVAGLDAWRTWCTAKGLAFNAVVDSQRSVWDILQAISRCGRGSPTWAPGKLGVVWDADNQPVVASFNMANIKRGTFEVAYQSEAPVEEVVLTYVDASAEYAPDNVRAVAPGVTTPAKSATIELWGCTDRAMAVKECYLALAENLYRTRLVSWETDLEGLVVTRGDVVSLSHDLTQWGKSGRLVSGTTTVLELDQAITLDSAGTWIGIIAPDGTQYTCRVAYQSGEQSTITLLDPLPVAPNGDNPIDWRYTADYVATPGKLVKIVSIVPAGMDTVRIQAVDEYDEYYAAENGTYTPPTKRPWLSNQPQIRGLGVTEEIVKSGGSYTTRLVITWTEAGNVASRLVRYAIDGGPLQTAGFANGSRYELMVPDAGSVLIVVTLYDGAGQTSSGAQASVTHNLQGLAYAPFELAAFTATGGLFQILLNWTYQGNINDVKHVEVWGGITNNRGAATLLTTMAAPSNGWTHAGLTTGQTWFYWARVIDHKGRQSDFLPLSATDGVSATTSSDPTAILDVLHGQIAETALDQSLRDKINADADTAALEQAIIEQGQMIDGLNAQYTVKIQAGTNYVAGYGLATTAVDGVPSSAFIVLADMFAVATPGIAAKYPFVVGTVNGQTTIGIDGTLVVDGSIVANKIDTRGLTIRDATGNVILSSGVPLDWARVGGSNRPEDGATVGAPAGTLVAGVSASTVATAATNFNSSNDRNGSAIAAPTVATTGTAVDHTIQTDGSADISFEWAWSGAEGDIDGFLIYVRQSSSSSAYTFGTTPAEETVYTVPAAKRAFLLFGTAADRYYTFGVQAYRSVDKAINSSGVINSTLTKATGSGENPYRPSSSVAFAGNVTGTIDGINTADINKWSAISGTGKPENYATNGATFGTNIYGQITQYNASTYIANAAIGNAQIGGDLWSSNWSYGVSGWYLTRSGDFHANNAYVRGDVEATSLKANTLMVQTAHVAGNAITVPVGASGTSSATTASANFGGAPVALIVTAQAAASASYGISVDALVYRDGVYIKTFRIISVYDENGGLGEVNSSGAWVHMDYPGAGSHYYHVQISGTPAPIPSSLSCGILAIGVKR